MNIRIATRGSALARWQAETVSAALQAANPQLETKLVMIDSDGEQQPELPLNQFGFKGIFTKRIEAALLENRADIAVHSMKDVHSEIPDSLAFGAILPRENPQDAWISTRYADMNSLPHGARIGTASVRRAAALKYWRSDLEIIELRGNVPTRLQKLEEMQLDGMILAAAGLIRLGLRQHIAAMIPMEQMLPAVAQGAIGVEYRVADKKIAALLAAINHADSHKAVMAERAMAKALDGDCHSPIGGHAICLTEGGLQLKGCWIEPDGSAIYQASASGHEPEALGQHVAALIRAQMP